MVASFGVHCSPSVAWVQAMNNSVSAILNGSVRREIIRKIRSVDNVANVGVEAVYFQPSQCGNR